MNKNLIESVVHSYISHSRYVQNPADTASLIEGGYVQDDRVTPTSLAIRYYLDKHIFGKTSLPLVSQLTVDNALKSVTDVVDAFSKVSRILSTVKESSSFIVTNRQDLFVSGLSNLFDNTLFCDFGVARNVLLLLDDPKKLISILESEFSLNPISVKIGTEISEELHENCVMISTYLYLPEGIENLACHIGFICSKDTDYYQLVAMLDYLRNCLEEKFGAKQAVFVEPFTFPEGKETISKGGFAALISNSFRRFRKS